MKPFRPPSAPVATNAILIGCVVVQVLMTLVGPGTADSLIYRAALIPARVSGLVGAMPGSLPAPVTLVTWMFIHGGWLHLGMNAIFMLLVGRFVEWVLGPGRLVALFLGGGVISGLAQVLAAPNSVEPVVGASGAIAAVFGCYAVLFAKRRVPDKHLGPIRIPGELLTALWFCAAWIALQLLTGLTLNRGTVGIAIWAHIGGFVAGILFAYLAGRRPRSNAGI